jgi:orotidine-5'-phosphate decarboxylase
VTSSAATGANPVFCAVDAPSVPAARALIAAVAGSVGGIKLGLEFFVAEGPQGVRAVMPPGVPLFLDLKLHDIPNTAAGAARAGASLSPAFVTLHAAGGSAMMREAAAAVRSIAGAAGTVRPRLLGVTVLTSLDADDLATVGQGADVGAQVERLALLAEAAGLDGVVCAPREVARLRRVLRPDTVLMVPGIRPAGVSAGDQKRVTAPAEALALGADYLVIGRPITAAPDPAEAARAIAAEIGWAA